MVAVEWCRSVEYSVVMLLLEWYLSSFSPVLEWYWTVVVVEWCRIGVLECSCVGARVVLEWCFTNAGVVLEWSDAVVVLWWWCWWWWSGVVLVCWSVVALVLEWCLSGVAPVLEWCWSVVVVVAIVVVVEERNESQYCESHPWERERDRERKRLPVVP